MEPSVIVELVARMLALPSDKVTVLTVNVSAMMAPGLIRVVLARVSAWSLVISPRLRISGIASVRFAAL